VQEYAVRYLRVSTDLQDEDNQIRAIDKFIADKGWLLVGTYRDHGISAYKENIKRPQFEQMIVDAKKMQFQHIVVFDLDRYSRQEPDFVVEQITTLNMMYKVQVNAVFGDEWRDVVNMLNQLPDMGFAGKAISEFVRTMFLGMQATRARQESEKISRRVKESVKFKNAVDKGEVGRPKIPPNIILMIKELLIYEVPYDGIKWQCWYKVKGKVKYPSEAIVSLVRTGKINI